MTDSVKQSLNQQESAKRFPHLRKYRIVRIAIKVKNKPKQYFKKLIRLPHLGLKWIQCTYFSPLLGRLYQYEPKPLLLPNKKCNPLTNHPSISIVTPSYNQSHFLDKTISSVLEQNYPTLEYIIQDGGSTDNSVEVIKRYQSSLKHWESKTDRGQSHALNLGFQHATGEIMAYLNSDDILFPNTLHYVADYFNKHPEVDVVYGHRILIDEHDNNIGRWILPNHDDDVLIWADYVPQETLFWRRQIWDKAGGTIDDSFRFAMDWDLLLRFKEANAKFVRLPRVLGAFRVHTQQKTSAQMNDIGAQEMERLRLRAHGRSVTRQEISKNIRKYLIKHIMYDKLYRIGALKY